MFPTDFESDGKNHTGGSLATPATVLCGASDARKRGRLRRSGFVSPEALGGAEDAATDLERRSGRGRIKVGREVETRDFAKLSRRKAGRYLYLFQPGGRPSPRFRRSVEDGDTSRRSAGGCSGVSRRRALNMRVRRRRICDVRGNAIGNAVWRTMRKVMRKAVREAMRKVMRRTMRNSTGKETVVHTDLAPKL